MKKTILILVLTILSLFTANARILDVPALGTDDGCWGSSMHMILNYYTQNNTPFYKEIAYQGGTRFEIRRQFIGGRLEDGTLNVIERDFEPKIIEPWDIAPENMPHLADDLGYTYHHAYLKSSWQYTYMDIREQEAGKENMVYFSNQDEAFNFLKKIVDDHMPAIVGAVKHFVVFTGYDNQKVYINNPNGTIVIKEIYNINQYLSRDSWGGSDYFMQWFVKTHEEKTTDDIMWMLKEAAARAYQNINYYADLTANGTITDDYTDPISGNNVNHPSALGAVAGYRVHIAEFLAAHNYHDIALKYNESAAKFIDASGLPQAQRVAVLKQAAEIEKQAYELFVKSLPKPIVNLNEPTEIKATSMKISWTPYPGNDFENYEVYVSWLPGVLGKKVKIIIDKSNNSLILEDLYRSRTYSITLKVNKNKSYGYSNQVTAQTSKDVYIISLNQKDNSFRVDWSDTLDKSFIRYEMYVSTEPGFEISENTRGTTISDAQVTEAHYTADSIGMYYFKIRTYYQAGFFDSEEKSAMVSQITEIMQDIPDISENVCGNNACNSYFGENYENCPQDCAPRPDCGDQACDSMEAGVKCPDGICDEFEKANRVCPEDCGWEAAAKGEDRLKGGLKKAVCGDKICDSGENHDNCPEDCVPEGYCGDGICDEMENSESCPNDCKKGVFKRLIDFLVNIFRKKPANHFIEDKPNAVCENTICEPGLGENKANCPKDCPKLEGEIPEAICGNKNCESPFWENHENCPQDCVPEAYCGNLICDEMEIHSSCPQDCGKEVKTVRICGDGRCDFPETSEGYPQDCEKGVFKRIINFFSKQFGK